MSIKLKMLNQKKLTEIIEREVENSNGEIGYMEIILDICDKQNIEIETIKKLISPQIKEKLEEEVKNRNMLKKE